MLSESIREANEDKFISKSFDDLKEME